MIVSIKLLVLCALLAFESENSFANQPDLVSPESQLSKILISNEYTSMTSELSKKYFSILLKDISVLDETGICLDLNSDVYQKTLIFKLEFDRAREADKPAPPRVVVLFSYDQYLTCSVVPDGQKSLVGTHPDRIRYRETVQPIKRCGNEN